ncbi:MAG: hypothetical protein ABIN24_08570 [Dyadobacter sp.]
MSQWFDWLFNPKVEAPKNSEGEIFLEGDQVTYAVKKGNRQTVIDLGQLQYIYVYLTENCQNLVLNDYHQHFIPCSINGFEIFFQDLSSRFLMDNKRFCEILASNKPAKIELWRASNPYNCRIHEALSTLPLAVKPPNEGFWICSTPPQWIGWDIRTQELEAFPSVYKTINEYGLTEIRFRYPVQIGNLILDDWRYYWPAHRTDVPLDNFYSNVHIQGNGDQNYFLAKKALGEFFGEPASAYEREDQNSCHWLVDGIKFALIYWYDSTFSYQSGYTYFNIKNERIYPEYLTDTAYELNLNISKYLSIEKSFTIGSDFRRSPYFRKTPKKVGSQLIISQSGFIIWLDGPNAKIGFANIQNAMIFYLEALVSFECENMLPDRNSGGAYLSAILKDGSRQCILIGDCYAFDKYIKPLENMIQLPVAELSTCE